MNKHEVDLMIVRMSLDLSMIKDRLCNNQYRSPLKLELDLKLMIMKSKIHNAVKRSIFHTITIKLLSLINERIKAITESYKLDLLKKEN